MRKRKKKGTKGSLHGILPPNARVERISVPNHPIKMMKKGGLCRGMGAATSGGKFRKDG